MAEGVTWSSACAVEECCVVCAWGRQIPCRWACPCLPAAAYSPSSFSFSPPFLSIASASLLRNYPMAVVRVHCLFHSIRFDSILFLFRNSHKQQIPSKFSHCTAKCCCVCVQIDKMSHAIKRERREKKRRMALAKWAESQETSEKYSNKARDTSLFTYRVLIIRPFRYIPTSFSLHSRKQSLIIVLSTHIPSHQSVFQ